MKSDIGMSLSAAINIYLKKLGREKRIPFEVAVDPFFAGKYDQAKRVGSTDGSYRRHGT